MQSIYQKNYPSQWAMQSIVNNYQVPNGPFIVGGTLLTTVDAPTAAILDAALPIEPGSTPETGSAVGDVSTGKFVGNITLTGTNADGMEFSETIQRK